MRGHWFCSGKCNDVVIMPTPYGRWDARRNVTCPVCHQDSADWTSAKDSVRISTLQTAVSPEYAANGFAQMKKEIE